MHRFAVVCFPVSLILAGCATTPTPTAAVVVSAAVHDAGAITQDRGSISVTRDTGIVGSACTYYILVDGVEVASVKAGQRVVFGADPGSRVVTTDVRGICGGGTANIQVNVVRGETTYLRAGATQTGDIRLEVAAPGFR